ncbi:MAG: SIS domain-containing protein [Desulfobacterales bacterium]|jgi:D-sedoheptulose 7-phosphate isomerase|nr:SIS domain-containing protein [Desulfobacterales bacterium]
MDYENMLYNQIEEHALLFSKIKDLRDEIIDSAKVIAAVLQKGNKVLICGNGGSAADSQHFAAELTGRFEKERESLPAIALAADASILTAIGNDFGFDAIFDKQVKGLGQKGDVLIGVSTSGNSANVVRAVSQARAIGLHTIGLLGRDGGEIRPIVHIPVVVPHVATARIQEMHRFILHCWANMIESELFP